MANSPNGSRYSIVSQGALFSISPPAISTAKKTAKDKAKKKPNPYFLFCQKRRTELHAQNPDIPSREITKQLAQEWKSLSDLEKNKYVQAYKNTSPEHAHTPPNLGNQIYLQVISTDGTAFAIPAFQVEKNNT